MRDVRFAVSALFALGLVACSPMNTRTVSQTTTPPTASGNNFLSVVKPNSRWSLEYTPRTGTVRKFDITVTERPYGSPRVPGRRYQTTADGLIGIAVVDAENAWMTFGVFLKPGLAFDAAQNVPLGEKGVFCDFETPVSPDGSYRGEGFTGSLTGNPPEYDGVCIVKPLSPK